MAKTTAKARYAHQSGRHFEDFTVGDIYHHLPGRTISQHDNAWFTLLTMNTHPLHFDEEYAAETEFGRPLVASPLTVAVIVGMSVSDVSEAAIANRWHAAVITPNRITITITVLPPGTL